MSCEIVHTGNVQLEVSDTSPASALTFEHSDRINQLWQEATAKNSTLYNGQLLNFVAIEPQSDGIKMVGHFTEYKNFLAQQKQTDLDLKIKPIGVSGLVVIDEKYILFGQRAQSVTEYPGYYELVSSGSIDQECVCEDGCVDYEAKIRSEFFEETQLPKDWTVVTEGGAVIQDTEHGVYDICCFLNLQASKAEVALALQPTEEYDHFDFVLMDDLDHYMKTHRDKIVPVSAALVEVYRKYNRIRLNS